MIRPDHVLHELEPSRWSEGEVLSHLRQTFDRSCRDFPGIMEPYATRIESVSAQEIKQFMRTALQETFIQRWPNRFVKPASEAKPK